MGSIQNRKSTIMPTEPGFYWITEDGMDSQIVEVVVSCATLDALQVLLPGDPQRYPLDLWDDVHWHGPLPRPE